MDKPILSEKFDLEDIRKIREYNAARYLHMTPAEIVEDTRKGAADLIAKLGKSTQKVGNGSV